MHFLRYALSLAVVASVAPTVGFGEEASTPHDKADSVMPTTVGAVGLLHMSSGDVGPGGILRFSATGEYFRAHDFPIPTATNTRSAGDFAISFVPVSFLELYGAYAVISNHNNSSAPTRIQSLGDVTAGLKLSGRWAPGVYGGAEGRVTFFTRVGSDSVKNYRYEIQPKLLLTLDFRDWLPDFRLRLHFNGGAAISHTHDLAQAPEFGPVEQYALYLNRYDRLTGAAGLEVPLPFVAPFAELYKAYPIQVLNRTFTGLDGAAISATHAYPWLATLGLRINPAPNLTFTGAVDIGLNRVVVLGVPATPHYNFYFGAAYAADAFHPDRKTVVKVVEGRPAAAKPKDSGRASGKVIDAATRKPVASAVLTVAGSGMPPVASEEDTGRFLTYELPAGTAKLKVVKAGYEDAEQPVSIQAGQTTEMQIELAPLPKKTQFQIWVTSDRAPVNAKVSLKGPVSKDLTTSEGKAIAEVSPGRYTVNVTADGYLAQTRELEISEGSEQPVSFELLPEPKEHAVAVKGNKIEMVQKIHFVTGQATLLPDSYPILAQIVDAIIRNDIKRVRIEGHTDSSGKKSKNFRLSLQRAGAVADYLEKYGIDPSRIETQGYGDTRPVVPNVTARGRELNRRVEITILDNER